MAAENVLGDLLEEYLAMKLVPQNGTAAGALLLLLLISVNLTARSYK